tara:strand:+ start:910 stop:1296 length:387 start_codon:yes stop_codon:yes gene_type:complete
MDTEKIVKDYIDYTKSDKLKPEDKALFRNSVYLFHDLYINDPEKAWELIVAIIDATDDEWVLTSVGCGELESLLVRHFDQFIDRVVKNSRKNKKFAFVMSCVWPDDRISDEQYTILDNLVEELGIVRK